jgi:hypothetical protein
MTAEYQGDPYQSPITLRTHAPRQTEEKGSPRLNWTRPRPGRSATLEDDNPDAYTVKRPHSSARRYDLPQHQGSQSGKTTTWLSPQPTQNLNRRRIDRTTLVIWCCLGLIVMIVGWWLLSWVANWWQGVTDNWQYGTPRTFQADHYVGLGDSPAHPDHFIALNLHGVIEVIQLNPQDHTKDAVYVLTSVGNASLPASLSFRDVDGDGKMDVVVTIGDSNPYSIVLLNNGKTFQPAPSAH